jgi:phage shock protein PspC (stress-responsive transcriptional regulator)
MEKRLTRIPSDAVLGGVASGMANYFGIDTTIVRVLWAVALLLPIPPSFFWTTMTRPKKSLHLLLINPDSNLHIFFNPKYCLLLLNPSLWSGA